MKIFVVEYIHKHGTTIWVATSENLAEEIVKTVQKQWFDEYDDGSGWTLETAMKDWPEFSGGRESFSIEEDSLVQTVADAQSVQG